MADEKEFIGGTYPTKSLNHESIVKDNSNMEFKNIISKAVNYCRREMRNIIKGKYDINKFIISKSLNGYYKDPDRIAHKVEQSLKVLSLN